MGVPRPPKRYNYLLGVGVPVILDARPPPACVRASSAIPGRVPACLPYIHTPGPPARTPHGTAHTTPTSSIHRVPKTAATGARQHHPSAIATGGRLPVYQSTMLVESRNCEAAFGN